MNLIDRNLLGENIANGMVHWEDIMNTPTVNVNELFISELEKIKAEMESRVKLNNDLENYDIATGLSIALGILDKHISELKGENKQTDVSFDVYDMKYIRCKKGENK